MPLIKEDGTCPAGANTYATIVEADAHNSVLGRNEWVEATVAEKETALKSASLYLDGLSWRGSKPYNRVMAWPRTDAIDDDGFVITSGALPASVTKACCEIAYEVFSGNDPLAVQGKNISSMSIGSINIQYGSGSDGTLRFPAVESILRGLTTSRRSSRIVW